jgi:glycosyltransferase involved in cell wall biosynthesis
MNLSVVILTRNEQENIGNCIDSVSQIADEVIVLDDGSTDNTLTIAINKGAKVKVAKKHYKNFHINKQKLLDIAKGNWILQLDADELVTPDLAKEIISTLSLKDSEIKKRKIPKILTRHQNRVEKRDGKIEGKLDEITAFFIPRLNFFLGKPLKKAGTYPDGVIRLVKKSKARFPAKSVHEQIQIDGKISWLTSPLHHDDSPTLERYIQRLNRYTDLKAQQLKSKKVRKNLPTLLLYSTAIPLFFFLKLYIRHLGLKDGIRGFLWCAFSASHYPISYFKYFTAAQS